MRAKESVRVLLSAFIGSKNLGDEAIFAVLSQFVPRLLGAELTVLSIDAPKTESFELPADTRVVVAGLPAFVRELRGSDALVLGGGGIIQDESSVVNLLYYALQARVARRMLKKPVYLAFVGVGPVTSRLGHWLLRHMAHDVAGSLVRDPESRDLLLAHGFESERIVVAFDPVFNLEADDRPPRQNLPDDFVVFCPRDWFFTRRYQPTRFALRAAKRRDNSGLMRYRRRLVELVAALLRRHPTQTVVGVPFFLSQDTELLEWISAQLPEDLRQRFTVLTGYISPGEYVAIARRSRAVLGMRLHSLILGALSGRPLVGLVYSAKVRSLIAYLGLGSMATELTSPELDVERVLGHVDAALSGGPVPDAEKLAEIVRTNQEVAAAYFGRIRQDLTGGPR